MKKGDIVRINMPGLPLHERQALLHERPGLKIASVKFGNGQVRLIPTKCLIVVKAAE